MSKINKYIAVFLPVFAAVGSFCFFLFAYPAHMHLKEQLLLFQFTPDYFRQVTFCPGGFADWCGRFLTQFCYWSVTGALISSALIMGVWALTGALMKNRTPFASALAFIPAIIVWMSLCHEYGVFGAPVALIIVLASAIAIGKIPGAVRRYVTAAVAVPVLYVLCGPLAIVFALVVLRDCRNISAWAVILGLAVACPFAAREVFAIRPDYLLRGWRYFFDPELFPVTVWVCAASVVLCIYLSLFDVKSQPAGFAAYLAVMVALPVAIVKSSDFYMEEEIQYGFWVRTENWDRIIARASKKSTTDFLSKCATNYALCRKGELAEKMFTFLQIGPEGLLPSYTRYHDQPVYAAEVYWHLAMINTCQRFYFESQEAIPDTFKSARYYQRLAETNAVNEDYAVSAKYRDALLPTLFYRKWAKNFDPQAPEYREKRELRFHKLDAPFTQSTVEAMLGQLYLENRANKDAYQYAMAMFLLKKDLGNFIKALSLEKFTEVPRSYQEAFLILFVENNHTLEGIPAGISPRIASRCGRFVEAYSAGRSTEYMQKHFGDTYWFYYYYVNYSEI